MLHGLRLIRCRFSLKSTTRIELNRFVGSSLRGVFGGVFRRLVCVTHMPTCDGCLLLNQCAYGYLFETVPPADSTKLRNYQNTPRPFLFEPPMQFAVTGDQLPVTSHRSSLIPHPSSLITVAPGDDLSFNLVLIGRAIDYLPYFVFVSRELEQHGLGRGRKQGQGQFRLHQVTALLPDEAETVIYDRDRDRLTAADATLTGQHILTRVQQLSHPFTPSPLHPFTPSLSIFSLPPASSSRDTSSKTSSSTTSSAPSCGGCRR